jgi:hypothetical protein
MPYITDDQLAEYRELKGKATRNATAKRRRVPGSDYVAWNRRTARHAPGYAAAGVVSLAELAELAALHGRILDEAVGRVMAEDGWAWSQVGEALGVTRQAAAKRWGGAVASTRKRGGQPAELR